MTLATTATHISRLAVIFGGYGITSPDKVFNIDECGTSPRAADLEMAQAVSLAARMEKPPRLQMDGMCELHYGNTCCPG